MMKVFNYLLIILIVLSSCSTSYSPTSIVPTGFSEAKEKSISITTHGTKAFVNTAYSPLKNFYVSAAAGASLLNHDATYNVNAGFGYYSTFGERWQFEVLSTFGFGQFDWLESDDKLTTNADYISFAKGQQTNWSNTFIINRLGIVKENKNMLSLAFRHTLINVDYEETNRSKLNHNSYTFYQFGPHIIYQESVSPKTNFLFQLGFEFNNDTNTLDYLRKEEQSFSSDFLFLRAGVEFKL